MLLDWVIFLICAGGIVVAGIRLAPYGDAIGQHLGIGQGWVGLILLATLTSIPEMTTTVTGASIGVPNIALGNAFGSNLFNVVIIAVMDVLLLRRGTFLSKVRPYHVVSGGVAISLTVLAILGMVLQTNLTILGIDLFSILIFLGYAAGIFLLFRAEKEYEIDEEPEEDAMALGKASLGFLICGVVIIVSGIFLMHASKGITEASGLSASLMGAILVAVVTSLPELATSIGALRIGARDMIVGNLFGSNMFNIVTIFFADAAYREGSIFSGLQGGVTDQLVVASFGILLTTVAVTAIALRSRRRLLGVGVDAWVLFVVYLGATAIIIGRGIQF